MDVIFGREREKNILEERYFSNKPELIVVYGRRRIGKTWLIREFFTKKNCTFFKTTGTIKERTLSPQIFNFLKDIESTFGLEESEKMDQIKTWENAFSILANKIKKHPKDKKIVLFFDEIPWLDTPRSRFISAFGHFWNHHIDSSENGHIKIIVCGSSTSWMVQNIIKEKGSLHQRKQEVIPLQPFTLSETKKYLENKGIKLSNKTILELYFAIGGVAEYLNKIKKGKSSPEIIEELFFTENAEMRKEFYALFSATFKNHKIHLIICEILSNSVGGLTRAQIIKRSSGRLKSTRELSEALIELSEASFLKKTIPFSPDSRSKGKNELLYKLIDEYSLFYFKWIHGNTVSFDDTGLEGYWTNLINSNAYNNWAGHAFESICHKNILKIKEKIKIIAPTSIHWWRTSPTTKRPGAEIDLLIRRLGKDNSVNICELKFYKDPLEITKAMKENIKNKVESFKEKNPSIENVFVTLITLSGSIKNQHYKDIIDNELTLEDLF